ncbi:MAG TPA: EAL domain-containing protein [Pyrinomonadaceae bacterium]|nr:EAL domain-containing protein [Pyrinomonadaceae bacterium]
MNFHELTKQYMTTVIICGLLCVSAALLYLPYRAIDLSFLVLFCLTIGVGSRITVQIPRFKSHIAVSDTFIFLALLTYGGEVAIVLSALEAFFSSWRFCNRKMTVFFNAAAVAISTTLVYVALKAFGLYSVEHLHGDTGYIQTLGIALSTIALVQFLANTTFASVHDSMKDGLPLWETWKNKYAWSFITYFVGAAGAGVLHLLTDSIGSGVILAVFPVIFFVFMTYRMYLKNIEISIQQADQAEQYAKILEQQSDALRESEERFRSAFNHAPIGIALVSANGTWLKVNHALCHILGYTEKEFLATDFQSMLFPEDLGDTLVMIHDLVSGKTANCQMEQRYLHKTGKTVWGSWSVSTAGDSKSSEPNLIFQVQDITGKKLAEEKLQHEATHDALTGLPNRKMFMQRLTAALSLAKRNRGYKVSVLFIDLDRFKYVNDSLGHLIGDRLLIGISERLRECMRPSDMVARLGGDEFTILVEGKYDISEVIRIAERIQHKFSMPFDLEGHEVFSSASIGILHASDQHLTSEDMMRDADTAMYQAKRAGKARHEVFDEKMHLAVKETLQLETDLRRAVENGEIYILYQPVFSLATRRIQGFEALTRWQHPQLGNISPSRFIAIAEEIGLMDSLGEYILERACSEIVPLLNADASGEKLTLSVNLSCRQFGQPKLVQNIKRILMEAGFPSNRLKLEITESIFFEYQAKALEMLNQIRELGVEIDIDDFGTGYSNLGYLIRLPISTLKIDRSFVAPIDSEGNNTEIVRTVLALARNLGLKAVAEGIETEHQFNALAALGCDGGQGYLFAEPMEIEKLRKYLNEMDEVSGPPVPFNNAPEVAAIQ